MTMQQLQADSYLFGGNSAFIEDLYQLYLQDPTAVPLAWREQFKGWGNGSAEPDHQAIQARLRNESLATSYQRSSRSLALEHQHQLKQVSVLQLINAYRFRGHLKAQVDPLALDDRSHPKELSLSEHNLSEADLGTVFNCGSLYGISEAPLREIIERLEKTYCGSIGAEYMYISDTDQKRWLQKRLEGSLSTPEFKLGRRRRILDRIIAAENLEKYLHTRYVGQKRFSLEGSESLIPLLDRVIQQAGKRKAQEVIIGMAHRGRLNVLTNIMGKMPKDLFNEFEGKVEWDERYNYDVKYHQGFASDVNTVHGPLHLALAFNPSHLEIVDPVVEGSVRARQHTTDEFRTKSVVPVLIHGDSAFAGQGVVMETFNMCNTRGYRTGGTIHIIVNNQIGFTTSHPRDTRSTYYCTEVARMVSAPIFHVNGDDPEACVFIAELAVDYRRKHKSDVIIDMISYRRYGHNEADEPAATQPMMYAAIRNHPRIVERHSNRLVDEGVVSREDVEQMIADYREALDQGGAVALNTISVLQPSHRRLWEKYSAPYIQHDLATGVDLETLQKLSARLLDYPEHFELHHRVKKIMDLRAKMASGERSIDWGFAELMSYASLLHQGHPVRLSGQDSERGTFFHRHAMLHNQRDGETYLPLKKMWPGQPRFEVINSLLSEEAVLGFEYGYASSQPNTLVIWEAQFGDFANGAQVVIDQFISSGEVKWGRHCGLALMLPHGYEGQGPEHSSARLERYLQLCAQDNMRVTMPSTPAQIFHLLRSQILADYRKPLIIMTPKSLLRHEAAVSTLEDLQLGRFRRVLWETETLEAEAVKRVILCSGKIYYKLREVRSQQYDQTVALVRIEQFYPYPGQTLKQALDQYPNLERIVWCQDEPRNQGGWPFLYTRLNETFENFRIKYAGRKESASPAVGYMKLHLDQEARLIKEAFED